MLELAHKNGGDLLDFTKNDGKLQCRKKFFDQLTGIS
jgi:hypothetical protein